MSRPKSGDNEIISLQEIHDEISRPLTSVNLEAVPSVRSRADSFLETGNEDNSRVTSESVVDHLQSVDKLSTDFDSRDLNNGLLPEHPVSSTWPDERDIFSSRSRISLTTPDVNIYQHKKTLAQGMMDLALLSANANQMRYVLQTDGKHPYFYPSLTMIGMSLFLQIAVGIGLIWNSQYNVKEHEQMCKANKANNWTVIGIFLVTILNVFISSFGVVDQSQTTT